MKVACMDTIAMGKREQTLALLDEASERSTNT